MREPPPPPRDPKQEDLHRKQVDLVQASLRAGVHYQRPGRVDKSTKRADRGT